MNRSIFLTLVLSLVALGGCFLNHPEPEPTFDVDVAIAAVSLADDCGAAAASRFAGDCAEPEPSDPSDPSGISSEDGCGGYCQGSSVSLAITADGDRALSFRIQRVILLDADDNELTDLSSDNARLYDATEGFVAWDETIPTPSELSVIYDLHGLDWSGIEDPYGRTFKLRVVVDIEGETRTLTSEETSREYPVVT